MDIVGIVLDFMHVHNFHYRLANGVKMFIFCANNSSSRYTDNRKQDTLFPDEGPTDGLDATTVTTESKYSIDITKSRKKVCLSLHCNASNNFSIQWGENLSFQSIGP